MTDPSRAVEYRCRYMYSQTANSTKYNAPQSTVQSSVQSPTRNIDTPRPAGSTEMNEPQTTVRSPTSNIDTAGRSKQITISKLKITKRIANIFFKNYYFRPLSHSVRLESVLDPIPIKKTVYANQSCIE